jgi:hypothetical protein
MKKLHFIIAFMMLFVLSASKNINTGDTNTGLSKKTHSFTLNGSEFLLDGKPFQIISGEIHYSRIPKEYWRQRIRMVKAMGCNTIAAYVFWNYHEQKEGNFDFKTGNRDLEEFIKLIQDEGMYMLFRPGPYSCGEWDLGGIPPYLLSVPDIKLRCMDDRYITAVNRYIKTVSGIIKPYLVTNGGPILMVQLENEYGSYGNDRNYMKYLKELWTSLDIDVPFYTSDGATTYMLEAGTLPDVAVGLDPGAKKSQFDLARKMNPGVPVFSSETYPGWLTHWGENWVKPDVNHLLNQVRFLMDNKLSFNFYVIHGGTNFGFTAGANSRGKGYEPDVTSYDYDAPINEAGLPREKYFKLRDLISEYPNGKNAKLKIPAAPVLSEIPEIKMEQYGTVWDNLPDPVRSVSPKPFESFGHYYGFAVYRTKLIGRKKGTLKITELHDYATVFLDGEYIGKIDRRLGEQSIEIPASKNENPVLEILVEGMGRINFAEQLIDRKGITERVSLNGMTLFNWDVFLLPMDTGYINDLTRSDKSTRPGMFFKGSFELKNVADTYIDMSNYKKGVVWVNGHNLGRYWEIGPQHSLYCPATFLKKGKNKIMIFDLLQTETKPVKGVKELM